VTRRPVDELLDALRDVLGHGDAERALTLLDRCESRWFLDGYSYAAAELGYARLQLRNANDDAAVAIVERLAAERTLR
jgi:hypothetical protein